MSRYDYGGVVMSESEAIFQQTMNQGHSAAWEQAWDQAAKCYRRALELIPNHPVALNNLGLAYFQMGNLEEAIKCYKQAAKTTPEDPLPLDKLGQIYEQMGRFDQAAKCALYAGELYLKTREVNRAVENWVRVTRNAPENIQSHSRLAAVYERLGQKPMAVREFLVLASLYQNKKDLENARRFTEHALKLEPDSREAQQAISMLKKGEILPLPTRPLDTHTEVTKGQTQQIASMQGVKVSSEQIDPIEEAHQNAIKALANNLFEITGLDSDLPDKNAKRGIQAIMSGARSLISKNVDPTRIALHLGQVFESETLKTKDASFQAAEELERAINAGLSNPGAFYELSYLRAQLDRLESAERYLRRTMNHQDYALGSRLLLAQIAHKKGRIDDASIEYLYALRIADTSNVREDQAKDLSQLYEPVIDTMRQQVDLGVKEHICTDIEGMLMRPDWRSHIEKARQQLNTQNQGGQLMPLVQIIIQTGGSNFVESLSWINQLARTGHLRSAMEETFFVLLSTPEYLPLHSYMGDLLLKQGQVEEAITKYVVVAHTYEARGEPDRAIDVYHRVIELAPLADTPRQKLITQLVARGQIDEAISESIDLAGVYYHLANLATARSVYLEALELADQSESMNQWQVKILHLIADIDIQSLDWRQALLLFDQICKIAPDDDKARYKIIQLNLRLAQKNLAIDELDKYLAYLQENRKPRLAVSFLKNLLREYPDWELLQKRLAQYQ